MFSLPQQSVAAPGSDIQAPSHSSTLPSDVIYVDEDAATLEFLLRLVCGQAIPKLDSYDVVEPLLYAAEKYDMPGPLSIVRALITTPSFVADPLRLYTLCCRYGWYEEAQTASTLTLTMNLHVPSHRATLLKLSSVSLLNLYELHHSRKDNLRTRLNETPFVNDATEASCSNCGAIVMYHTWRELKYVIITEMDVRPMGDTILEKGLDDWPAAKACWEAKCQKCDRVLYDKRETLKAIKQCMDKLPNKIELVDASEERRSLSPRK
ncbi:hypothetical protein EIP91_008198 [Steccherinum ochraceum]|uniref:BTB domain-containing protein n=1 Tax=Steccherinum ochraceum TaxID=92696 RepID=A0A4R0RQ08_9APHY|nr:hypothetical protein EIP91_008198 [Steccherinum ochraceum]